jgi:hypothetical protein
VIVTFPDRLPVTRPLPDTVAVLVLELDQEKLWFGMTFPLLSNAAALSCIVDPGFSFFDGAVTLTFATAGGVGVAPAGGVGLVPAGGVGAAPVGGVGVAPATGLTVTVALLDLPSLAAVMVVDPAQTPVMSPDPFTVATPALLDVQAIARSDIAVPLSSRADAES